MTRFALLRSAILAAVALGFAALAAPASAGVATSGAVLLDPFDPVPEIQFRHYGGYGCVYGCGVSYGCDSGCYNPCRDGCRRHVRRHDCDDGCTRRARNDCDDRCCADRCDRHDDCDRDCGNREAAVPPPCTSGNCYDAEHYERRWRDGDKVGQEWVDRGRRERMIDHGGPGSYYGHDNFDWHDDDAAPAAPPPPAPPPGPPGSHH